MARTVWDRFRTAVSAFSDREALVFPDERTTYQGLATGARAMAVRLAGIGVRPGDRVGILMGNSPEFVQIALATAALGAVLVPLNARYVSTELGHSVQDSDVRVLIMKSGHVAFADRVLDALPQLRTPRPEGGWAGLPELQAVVELADRSCPPFLGVADFESTDDTAAAPESVPGEIFAILYTSGTTRSPRGCIISHEALIRTADALAQQRFLVTDADRLWNPLPMFHIAALLPLFSVLFRGGTVLSMAHFSPEAALQQIARERATIAFAGFQAIATDIIDVPSFERFDLGSLRIVHSSGTPENLRRVQAAFPHAVQTSPYGCTELCGLISTSELTDDAEARATTSGRPFAGQRVKILDLDSGAEAVNGAPGEILVQGFSLFLGYHNDPEKSRAAIDADGWFHTGDIGAIDADGRLRYLGRTKDMIKVGGENVACVEIENTLEQHPAVRTAQVVGVPDPRLDEVPVAFAELKADATALEADLIEYCRGRIASFKVPRRVVLVDEWPMSTTKVDKAALRRAAAPGEPFDAPL